MSNSKSSRLVISSLEALEERQLLTSGWYDLGNPNVVDLWVSPTSGSDANLGTSANAPLRSLGAAWGLTATGLDQHGYRINLLAGTYLYNSVANNYLEARHGTFDHPILIQAANGPGTVTIEGGLNINDVTYFGLINLSLVDTQGGQRWGNNVLHIAAADHVLLRGDTIAGPSHSLLPDNFDIQEDVKLNQVTYAFMEGCEVSGTYQTGVDFFAAKYGHIYDNYIHDTGDWGMYLKGGSAYYRVEGNHFDNTRLGFQAGEGSTFNLMLASFIHYEAYDIKFVNNLLTNIPGTTMSVAGGYNILLADNTLYHVAFYSDAATGGSQGFSPITVVHGSRDCSATTEVPNAEQICSAYVAQGGWGPTVNGDQGDNIIPCKNVWIMNNVVDNPSGSASRYSHFVVDNPITPPAGTGIPNPSRCDDGLIIQGNILWNSGVALPLGINDPTGVISASNTINRFEPQFVDPTHGNFHPLLGGNLIAAASVAVPDFTWSDAPTRPAVPVGNLSNLIPVDMGENARPVGSPPGAYVAANVAAGTPPPSTPSGSVTLANAARILVNGTTYLSKLVTTWYADDLGRIPSANDVAPYVSLLQSGLPVSSVRALIVGSPEFVAVHGGPDSWIDTIYMSLLGRHVDSAGLQVWGDALNRGIDRISIASAVGASTEGRTEEVVRLFQTVLSRTPSFADASVWAPNLATSTGELNVIADLAGSPEFVIIHPGTIDTQLAALGNNLFAGLPAPTGSVDTFGGELVAISAYLLASDEFRVRQIDLEFQQLLGRTPPTADIAPFVSLLASGGTIDQVVGIIAGSDEYVSTHGGPDNWLNSVFQDVLGRSIDPTGRSVFSAALTSGLSRTTIATIVASSPETHNRQVIKLYVNLLGRSATLDDAIPWAVQITPYHTISSIETAFVGSEEYAIRRRGAAASRIASLVADLWTL